MIINTITNVSSYTRATTPNIFSIKTIDRKSNIIVLYPETGEQLSKNIDLSSRIVINYENLQTQPIIEQ